ncbi:hypothetical protein AMATHDRAFT_64938 [Amanita thiersii Skay4041]|uniref:Hydrophobin n=1 Tax=Amanita thiersii Skay4041 TaxID=703135 RepID=A0A2A9NK15_9AGAR|nr:hypothetical protein AMATHDRAFT_64938 [Amanita thiersii Skay4041]
MMSRVYTIFFFLFFASFAAATAVPRTEPSCSTGTLQCCNSTQQSSSLSTLISGLLTILGVNVGSLTGLVGVTCSPITVIGVSGTNCNAQTVCCTNNNFNGVVALGCTPININL